MVANNPDIEKSIGRQSSLLSQLAVDVDAPDDNDDDDGGDRAPRSPRSCRDDCPKDHCDAPVRRHRADKNGTTVEYHRCTNGHFVRERLLDSLAASVVSATIRGP